MWRFPVFHTCVSSNYPCNSKCSITSDFSICWWIAQSLGQQDECCSISINDHFDQITLLFGTATQGTRCQKEGSLNFYCIKSMDNDADELKIHWNNKLIGLPRTCQKDLLQTFQLPNVHRRFFHSLPWSLSPVFGRILSKNKKYYQNTRRWSKQCPTLKLHFSTGRQIFCVGGLIFYAFSTGTKSVLLLQISLSWMKTCFTLLCLSSGF